MVFVLAIMVIVGLRLLSHSSSLDKYSSYNGFEFTRSGNYWITSLERNGNLFEAPFYIHPLDLESRNYSYDPLITKLLVGTRHSQFTIAVSPDEYSIPVLAGVDIARILGKFYGIPTKSSLYIPVDDRNESITYENPIVDCSEASVLKPVIWITSSLNKTGVFLDHDNPACVIVSGSADTPEGRTTSPLVELADLLAYKILLVMN